MPNIRSVFLRRVKTSWGQDLPFLKPVDIQEIPQWPKGTNFICDDYFGTRGVFYFIAFNCFQGRTGEFSLSITVSPSLDHSVLDSPKVRRPSPANVGSYGIGAFLEKQNFVWALVNVNARVQNFFQSMNVAPPVLSKQPPNTCFPSSFDAPADQIAQEAEADVSEKLNTFVFPKLEINVPELWEKYSKRSSSAC